MSAANKNPSTTKAGPGRKHVAGHKKATPRKQKGAGVGFVQHTNGAKNATRNVKRDNGQHPDLSAQRAQDAKAKRSQKARANRRMGA
jgi:hypothetical protein